MMLWILDAGKFLQRSNKFKTVAEVRRAVLSAASTVDSASRIREMAIVNPEERASVTEVPHQSMLRTKTRFNAFHHHYKIHDIYTKILCINKAVAVIQSGEFIYYANAADKYYKKACFIIFIFKYFS